MRSTNPNQRGLLEYYALAMFARTVLKML